MIYLVCRCSYCGRYSSIMSKQLLDNILFKCRYCNKSKKLLTKRRKDAGLNVKVYGLDKRLSAKEASDLVINLNSKNKEIGFGVYRK